MADLLRAVMLNIMWPKRMNDSPRGTYLHFHYCKCNTFSNHRFAIEDVGLATFTQKPRRPVTINRCGVAEKLSTPSNYYPPRTFQWWSSAVLGQGQPAMCTTHYTGRTSDVTPRLHKQTRSIDRDRGEMDHIDR